MALPHGRMNLRRRLEPDALDELARGSGLRSTSTSPRVTAAVAIFGAHAGALHAHRPHAAVAAEQRAQPVDRRQEVAAVALHHREQQVAAGVAAEAVRVDRSARARAARGALRPRCARAPAHISARRPAADPSSSRSWPELPPLSNIVTTAFRRSHGLFLSPPSRLGRPVPPPKHPTFN